VIPPKVVSFDLYQIIIFFKLLYSWNLFAWHLSK
jgi:hypothetical protein